MNVVENEADKKMAKHILFYTLALMGTALIDSILQTLSHFPELKSRGSDPNLNLYVEELS